MIEDISSRIADGADQTLKNGESMEEIQPGYRAGQRHDRWWKKPARRRRRCKMKPLDWQNWWQLSGCIIQRNAPATRSRRLARLRGYAKPPRAPNHPSAPLRTPSRNGKSFDRRLVHGALAASRYR